MVTIGYYWLLLLTIGYYWLLWVTIGYSWLLLVTIGYYRLLWVTIGYYFTIGYYRLLVTTHLEVQVKLESMNWSFRSLAVQGTVQPQKQPEKHHLLYLKFSYVYVFLGNSKVFTTKNNSEPKNSDWENRFNFGVIGLKLILNTRIPNFSNLNYILETCQRLLNAL